MRLAPAPSSSAAGRKIPNAVGRAKRKNVSRACEYCRTRKAKCSGDLPTCAFCEKHRRRCVYPNEVDKRLTDRTAHEKIRALQSQVQDLQSRLREADPSASLHGENITTRLPSEETSSPTPAADAAEEDDSLDSEEDVEPFESGRLVLSSTGNLHLFPTATFYRPAHVVPEWQYMLESLVSRPVPLPGYLASYLPFPMAENHHRALVDLAFDTQVSFGPNPFRDRFVAAMELDPDAKGLFFSPMLHLCVLGVGWRYCRDAAMIEMYYPNVDKEQRGKIYITAALGMFFAEAEAPKLCTILASFMLTLYHVGMLKDSLAGVCFMMGQYMCMDFRLHKQCDAQLAELGSTVGSDLDIARRDVWGFAHNFSAWWSTFYAQPTLPLVDTADQREPVVQSDHPDINVRTVSLLASLHTKLSKHGLQALNCNHLTRLSTTQRIAEVRATWQNLLAWRLSLPLEVSWPPAADAHPMHPGNIVTHGMYATYVILLFRPYIIETRGSRRSVPEALERCMSAAREIVDQCHYLAKHHGVHRAPLSWQHTIYVAGTMLVLQSSGLSAVSPSEADYAMSSLEFLQARLDEFAYVWPAAAQTAESLRHLQQECRPKSAETTTVDLTNLDLSMFNTFPDLDSIFTSGM